MTLDSYPLDRLSPAGRFGSTVNAVFGAGLVALGMINESWAFVATVSIIELYFVILCVRAWRGDYDNLTTWEVMKNPFGPARPRTPGAGLKPPGDDGPS